MKTGLGAKMMWLDERSGRAYDAIRTRKSIRIEADRRALTFGGRDGRGVPETGISRGLRVSKGGVPRPMAKTKGFGRRV